MSTGFKAYATVYNSRAYKAMKELLRSEWHQCWVIDDRGRCLNRGTTPDHDPPLALHPNPREWRGVLRPMCAFHSRRQSGLLRHGRTYAPPASREW